MSLDDLSLDDLGAVIHTLAETQNAVQFELGDALGEAKSRVPEGHWGRWIELHTPWRREHARMLRDWMAVARAFHAGERHQDKSWSAHREAMRATEALDMPASDILDAHPTVAAIRDAVRAATGAPSGPSAKRVPLDLLLSIEAVLLTLRDSTALSPNALDEIASCHEAILSILDPAGAGA